MSERDDPQENSSGEWFAEAATNAKNGIQQAVTDTRDWYENLPWIVKRLDSVALGILLAGAGPQLYQFVVDSITQISVSGPIFPTTLPYDISNTEAIWFLGLMVFLNSFPSGASSIQHNELEKRVSELESRIDELHD